MKKFLKRRWKLILALSLGLKIVFSAWLIFWVKIFDLPSLDPFLNYRPFQTTYFLDRHGEIIGCLAEEWRDILSTSNTKDLLVTKVIKAVEDRRFDERAWGIDPRSILRALEENITSKRISQGGSTLQQQLVKQLLSPEERRERSVSRKIKEVFLTFGLMARFGKDDILTLYLNEIYLGGEKESQIGQVYGIEAAARYYFNQRASDLTLANSALIASIVKSPANLSPKKYPELALKARNNALSKAYQEGNIGISEKDYEAALKEPIGVTDDFQKSCQRAPHAVWQARKVLRKEHNLFFDTKEIEKAAEEGEEKTDALETLKRRGVNYARLGLRVVTSLKADLQRFSEEGVKLALAKYKDRQKDAALPDVESAFIVLENGTNGILSMVGSSDYKKNKFNHAVNSQKAVGSSIKPVVYAALFEEELRMDKKRETILDLKISNAFIDCPGAKPGERWQPKNYDEKKFGAASYTRRFAIAQSINRAAVHAAERGRCELHPRILAMAEKLGIKKESLSTKREVKDEVTGATKVIVEEPRLPIALGASGIPIIDLAKIFSVFVNKGVLREPYLVEKIYDAKGGVKYEKKSWNGAQVITEDLASVMVEALRGVVKFGTAQSMNTLPQPTACKTGTTNRFTDALLTCFTPHAVFSAWIGGSKDNASSLGDRETGAKVVGPAVKYVLEKWYEGYAPAPFQEEAEGWSSVIVDPKAFEKEMESIKDDDPDVEASQEKE